MDIHNWLKEKQKEISKILTSLDKGEEIDEELLFKLTKEYKFCIKEL